MGKQANHMLIKTAGLVKRTFPKHDVSPSKIHRLVLHGQKVRLRETITVTKRRDLMIKKIRPRHEMCVIVVLITGLVNTIDNYIYYPHGYDQCLFTAATTFVMLK